MLQLEILEDRTVADGALMSSGMPNMSFALTGLNQVRAPEGSSNVSFLLYGSGFDTSSVATFNGRALMTVFLSPTELQATIPHALLRHEGQATIQVVNAAGQATTDLGFAVTESRPKITTRPLEVSAGAQPGQVRLAGSFFDLGNEAHQVQIDWGDGTLTTSRLGVGYRGRFAVTHTYPDALPRIARVSILDDVGTSSRVMAVVVRPT
jgi:hypothetical protein